MTDAQRSQPELDDERLRQVDDAITADEVSVPDGRSPGRLVEPDEGAATDDEAAVIAELVDDADAPSAEEAAIHIVDES